MKMKKIFKIKVILVIGLILTFGSCTKDWEEMNTNPNEPVTVPATNVLAYSLRYFADTYFDDWMGMNNFGGYAGQVTKIQYIDEARYQERESAINNAWRDMYTTLSDLQKVIKLSEEEGNTNLKAVAMTFQAFMFHTATDLWKSIPYSNALQGEQGVSNPTYDKQQDIYYKLLENLKEANSLFITDVNDLNYGELGEGDLLFNGDVLKWKKFCNSLRLRVAIRMSRYGGDGIDEASAKTHIEEVLDNPASYPILESNDDNVFFMWPGVLPYYEPWSENYLIDARDDHAMCETIIDTLKTYNDPRLPVYAYPATSDGEYRGLVSGAIDGTFSMDDISRIGFRFRDDPAGFTPFMRYSEVMFIIAEAAKNGWSTGWTAQGAYEAAVTASLEENGIASGDIATYLANPKVAWNNNYIQIYLQKWIALFKECEEAWAECRRTDIPEMHEAPGSPYQTHNRPPFRWRYPDDEYNLNSANIAPAAIGIVDYFWGQQMWWDTRTGVH